MIQEKLAARCLQKIKAKQTQTQGQIQAHKYFGTPDNNFMAVILILVRMNIDSYSI